MSLRPSRRLAPSACRYCVAMQSTILPTGGPLTGRWVRLDALSAADVGELAAILSDPAVYADGYVMHRRPVSREDARDLARSVFLTRPGQHPGEYWR